MTAAPLLAVEGLNVRFGGVTAIEELDLAVAQGTVHGLIGPNGAGKTTAFNVISGILRPTSGAIHLAGQPIGRLPPYRRTALGLARTFQNIRMFQDMTVLENVMTGRTAKNGRRRAFDPSARRLFPACGERSGGEGPRTLAPRRPRRRGVPPRGRSLLMAISAASRSRARSPQIPKSCSWMSLLLA